MVDKKIPILIVNYNTPEMVYYNILSINKTTPNCLIYVFDNSDKEEGKFVADEFTNVIVLDNTKDQYFLRYGVDFYYKYWRPSIMHSKTVQAFIDKIDVDGFILLDSDVIVIRDLNEIYDERFSFVGTIENGVRLNPFCCFINSKMCRDKKIEFYSFGAIKWDGRLSMMKDSGYLFFQMVKDKKPVYKIITARDYVHHFSAGSYRDSVNPNDFHYKNYKDFLEANRQYLEVEEKTC